MTSFNISDKMTPDGNVKLYLTGKRIKLEMW